MTVKTNTVVTTGQTLSVREIDFVSQFNFRLQALRDLMGIARPIRKQAGTQLVSKVATITLGTSPAEGDEIPYSAVAYTEVPYGAITIQKYAKGITGEMVSKYGYDVAVAKSDQAFINKLAGNIQTAFYTYLATGSLTGTATGFQSKLAKAKGLAVNFFKSANLDASRWVGFVNVKDFYDYVGSANITVQNQFGLNYIVNFMGYDVIFLLSDNELASGKVICTSAENLNMYYVNPNDSDFARAGFEFTTDELGLIGVHTEAKYSHFVSEMYAIMGVVLFAEYLNGIAVVSETTSGNGQS